MFQKKSGEIIKYVNQKDKHVRFFNACIGLLIMAISYNLFFVPNNIVYGGMSGLGIIFNNLYGINPSIIVLVGSAILLIFSYFLLGKAKTIGSIAGSLIFPLFIEITAPLVTYIDLGQIELLLTIIIGSIISGFGSGMVYKNGYSSGGTDIANQIIAKYGKMPISNAMLFTDGLIILIHLFFFGWYKFVYSVVAIIIFGIVADKVLLGISQSKAFYIVTSHEDEVKEYILDCFNVGITVFNVTGGYSGVLQKMLMCAIPTKEYFRIKEGILKIDPNAFFLVTDAYEVYDKKKRGGGSLWN